MTAQKYNEKKKISNRRWDEQNIERLSIAVPKGEKDQIKAHAESQGESLSRFALRAMREAMQREGGKNDG
jgi:uncharacterized protein (DUF1778 family)